MSLPIDVRAYSGYRANERPIHFCVDEDLIKIAEVEDRWYDFDAEYLKVRSTEGKRYLLRCSRKGEWSLQSAFDGAELLARPSIELITVDANTIRAAELQIAGCERCRDAEAELLFDAILADVTGKHGAFEFVMAEPANCPNCRMELNEKSLVELQGGIEADRKTFAR